MSSRVNYTAVNDIPSIELPASKSIANRLLIAQALADNSFAIKIPAEAKDSRIMRNALQSNEKVVDVGMAGTAYRFLTAYFSIQKGERILTGAARMKERPIKILIDQLRELGAEIEYLEKEGYPPIRIRGKELASKKLRIDGSVSSQYITALLLIAPGLKNGLTLELQGSIVSLPYIDMTIQMMNGVGIQAIRKENTIEIKQGGYASSSAAEIEVDWSSAAFFYQFVAFSKRSIRINGLIENSIQGDKIAADLFRLLGVETVFEKPGVMLKPINIENDSSQLFDMVDCPDLIPSVAVVASQCIDETIIKGVSTLRIKESNRLEALRLELAKIDVRVEELDSDRIKINQASSKPKKKHLKFHTYNDHRMAMCLASLAVIYPQIEMDDHQVVEKSFPSFWEAMEKVGVKLDEKH